MNYLLDTNHATILLSRPALPKQKRMDVSFMVCTPILGELWYGVLNSQRREENEANLATFLRSIDVIAYDALFVKEFGRIRAELKIAGKVIPQIDVQLAAVARVLDVTVLTADRHLTFVSKLRTENWLT